MNLWRLYQFLYYIDKHETTEAPQLQALYRDQMSRRLSDKRRTQILSDTWQRASEGKYIDVIAGKVSLTYRGRDLIELHGLGLVAALTGKFAGILALIAAVAAIIGIIR